LIKLISSVGPYDYLLEKTENEFKLYSKEKIRKGNSLTDYRIDDFEDDLKIRKERKRNHQNNT
jgi:hypothetical protein